MNKNFEKNRLDLAYNRQLSHLNAILTLGSIGVISFIGTFIWNKDYLIYGFLFTILISIISYFLYVKVNKRLEYISNKIKEL